LRNAAYRGIDQITYNTANVDTFQKSLIIANTEASYSACNTAHQPFPGRHKAYRGTLYREAFQPTRNPTYIDAFHPVLSNACIVASQATRNTAYVDGSQYAYNKIYVQPACNTSMKDA